MPIPTLNALIAKLIHVSRDTGRDWHTGQEFPLRQSQDIVDMIRESAAAAQLARALLVQSERDREGLHASLIAMRLAASLPGVADEYDFSEAIAIVTSALATRSRGDEHG